MIHENGNALLAQDKSDLEKREPKQEQRVKEFYLRNPNVHYSAEDVHRLAFRNAPNTPLTSVRRCLTDLMKSGFLCKDVNARRLGLYGIKNVTYVYKVRALPKGAVVINQLKIEI